ncbi:MAG: hypothetical protein U0232_21570 [Thermomicrobiales bacterium]
MPCRLRAWCDSKLTWYAGGERRHDELLAIVAGYPDWSCWSSPAGAADPRPDVERHLARETHLETSGVHLGSAGSCGPAG